MKKMLLISVLIFTLTHYQAKPNPIIEEDFITEIYFEDGNWFLMFNNWAMFFWGINSFQDFSIFTNNGALLINPDLEPDFQQYYTVITVDDLLEPVELSPNAGSVTLYYDDYTGYWIIQDFSWGNPPGTDVGPVLPGQSINWLPVVYYENYEVIWMAVKNAEPYYLNGYGDFKGNFQGYLKDQYNDPVADAEIRYVNPYIMWPNSGYTPLITGSDGFFQKDIYARNYKLSAVIKDDVEYPIDYWLIMEPNTTITMEVMVDITTGIAEVERIYHVTLNNYPNPFSEQTTIELKIDETTHFNDGYLNITQLNGANVAIIPLSKGKFDKNIFRYNWNGAIEKNLPNGQYIVTAIMDGQQVATGKMVIAR